MKSEISTGLLEHLEREAKWRAFAARHDLEIFQHSHGFLLGARGYVAGVALTAAESPDGLSLEAPTLLGIDDVVLCDQLYYDWCRQPAQVQSQESAMRYLEKGRRRRRESALDPALSAATAPHRSPAAPPQTGNQDFDRRFLVLFPNATILGSMQVIDALLELPSCVQVHLVRHCLRAILPKEDVADDLWHRFFGLAQEVASLRLNASG